jgi:hypothetical protein
MLALRFWTFTNALRKKLNLRLPSGQLYTIKVPIHGPRGPGSSFLKLETTRSHPIVQIVRRAEHPRRVRKAAPIFNQKGYDGTALSDLMRATGLGESTGILKASACGGRPLQARLLRRNPPPRSKLKSISLARSATPHDSLTVVQGERMSSSKEGV